LTGKWSILSADDDVQKMIREGKDLLANKSPDDFLKFIEKGIKKLEENDQFIESVILWHFVAEVMENLDDQDNQSYAYSKLISRYLLLDDLQKAEEVFKESISKELSGFHLDTVRTIFERRSETKSNREIISIRKMDIFGDLDQIPASPSTMFENVSLVRRYVHNFLPEGTFSVTILNHKSGTTEELEISTEKLVEYEVISIQETVRVD